MKLALAAALVCLLSAGDKSAPAFDSAAAAAESALTAKDFEGARAQIQRALERDPKAPRAWDLRARWAEAVADRDELVYSLYKEVRLLVAQRAPKAEIDPLRKKLESIDPVAADLAKMKDTFVKKLLPIAERYEKEGRPHSAIRVHQQILALDPERRESEDAIQKISAAPDPSLAETAKPKDLLADVSEEWIRAYDAKHSDWKNHATLKRDNYVTNTDAGYEVLVRASEAMEQMNAFYRIFFHYGTPDDKKSVPRIDLEIFKNRDEYLKLGSSPPDWSGGQFTGRAVQTYVGQGGLEEMTGTLFHEAAHQFVGLATNAAGWLNEGLASFFEGCRILSNGTVIMNLPANHRLFPLVDRMSKGWMTDASDGIDPKDPSKSEPPKAPTFRIVLENKYAWGPPWYAPTWGVVYFLYDYQDPVDGRFVYRSAFRDFINASGGKVGDGAVENFEKVVLAHPEKPTAGVDFAAAPNHVKLPKTVAELDEVWKEWMTQLRDEQAGKLVVKKPYLEWARHAIARKQFDDATEHFEKGLAHASNDVDLLVEFADLLATRGKNVDRATKLVLQALRIVESSEKVDDAKVKALEHRLVTWDPKRDSIDRIHVELALAAKGVVERYLAAGLPMMTMEVAGHLGTDLRVPGMFPLYEEAARKSGKSLAIWKLAYDERDLEGWAAQGNDVFFPYGDILRSKFGAFEDGKWDYRFLTLDTVTSGDFSMEADVQAEAGKNAFCGLVFGRKGLNTFHALVFFPGTVEAPTAGYVDLASFYEASTFKTWRHESVDTSKPGWHTLRVDVSGTIVDVWFDKRLVATQEFASLDVLRGSFGLFMGLGEAQYRNVRYLAREARDPAASIERKILMESLAKAQATAPRNDGSWLGRVPPFPEAVDWIGTPRKSWDEKGPVPTLLVLWSIKQNEIIPIHEWLSAVKAKYADVGLEIVSVCEPADGTKATDYVKTHPFPGSVAVDTFGDDRDSIGVTLDSYAIDVFNLPRVLLLGPDRKVAWAGDPGFSKKNPWKPGAESYLDAPLDDLVDRLKLRKVVAWRQTWTKTAQPALREGRFEVAMPSLIEAKELPKEAGPDVADARRFLEGLEAAVSGIDATTRAVAGAGAEPALAPLITIAAAYGKPIDPKKLPAVRSLAGSPNAKAWDQALGVTKKALAAWKPGEEKATVEGVVRDLAPLAGYFPKHLSIELRNAMDANDWADAKRLLEQAPTRPAAWLVTDQLRF